MKKRNNNIKNFVKCEIVIKQKFKFIMRDYLLIRKIKKEKQCTKNSHNQLNKNKEIIIKTWHID